MANFLRGLAGGFKTGVQIGDVLEQRQLRDALAQENAKYGVTEGAYGPGLQENIQQLEGLKAQDPAQAAVYDESIKELTRRQGLTAPDYSVASGATNYGTRQEARQAAAPLRAEGLAGVYRQYGDVAKADELEARAYDQQRALAAEERAKAAEGRAVTAEARAQQDFATGQTEKGLRINQLTRIEAEQQRASDFSNFAAENPNMSVAELKDAAFKQFKFSPKQWQETVTTRLGIENAEMDSFKNSVKKKLQGKNLSQLGSLYNTDPDFDDKTDLSITPGKGGSVTLSFIDKATNTVKGAPQSFRSEALAIEYLNKQATEPETIGTWMLALQKTEGAIEAQSAAAAKDRAVGGLYAQGGAGSQKTIEAKIASMERSLGRKLTEDEKLVQFGISPKPSNRPEFTQADVTARARYILDNDQTGKITPDQALQQAAASLSGKAVVSPEQAKMNELVDEYKANKAKAAAAPTAAPAPAAAPTAAPAAAPAPVGLSRGPSFEQLTAGQGSEAIKAREAGAVLQQAQQAVRQAAQSGDQLAVAQAMQNADAANKNLDRILSVWQPSQASKIKASLGF